MINVLSKGSYSFTIHGKNIEVFISEDGHVEMYEADNPAKTGFYFGDIKGLIYLCNSIGDIIEHYEEKNEQC